MQDITIGYSLETVIGLTWKQLQFSAINGNFIRFIHEKTDRPQNLIIPQQAIDILGPPQNPDQKIFEGLKYSVWTNLKLAEWVLRAGITKKITFHCFRHSFATFSFLWEQILYYTVSKLLNHKNIKTTQFMQR